MESILHHILSLVIFVPLVGAAILFTRTRWDSVTVRQFALLVSGCSLILALIALRKYLFQSIGAPGAFHLIEQRDWITGIGGSVPLRVQYYVGVDGISMPLLLLTAFLTPLAIWGSFTGISERHREYYSLMLFYVFFEFTLIPLYFLIGIWGGSQRTKAANMFFLYTLAGSMLTFAGVMYLGWKACLLPGNPNGTHLLSFDLDRLYQLSQAGLLSVNA